MEIVGMTTEVNTSTLFTTD